jgi:hypothetical protein
MRKKNAVRNLSPILSHNAITTKVTLFRIACFNSQYLVLPGFLFLICRKENIFRPCLLSSIQQLVKRRGPVA